MALLSWERGDKRGYLFEDGALRVIAKPYYHLMHPRRLDRSLLPEAFRRQISQMSLAKAKGMLDPNRSASKVFTIEEQVQLFAGQFEGGFSGKAWQKKQRGLGARQRLKRHRAPAIDEAQGLLDAKNLAQIVTEQQDAQLWQDICKMLRATDIVPLRDVKAFEQRLASVTRSLTLALAALLRSEPSAEASDSFASRFTNFVNELHQVLGRSPSWPLATSFLALVYPTSHVCVHPGSLAQEGKWMGDKTLSSKKPNVRDYERVLEFAEKLKNKLAELELDPTDLLDVYDFIRNLTTPAAKKRLEALRQSDLQVTSRTVERGQDSQPPAVSGSGEQSPANDRDQEAA